MSGPILAWHFVGTRLRDGRPVPKDGEVLVHHDRLVLCQSGLHASVDPFDALQYARGSVLCRVEMGGTILRGDDKLVASERTIVCRRDMTDVLYYFARMQALSVVDRWDAPDVVLDYLMTGDKREAAWSAAYSAARSAARSAAWSAARSAAESAAWSAARYAADSAAWSVARSASESASKSAAAWPAAWSAARSEFNQLVAECFDV